MPSIQSADIPFASSFPVPYAKPKNQPIVGKAVEPQSNGIFSTLKIKDCELKNRIMVSPMCQYSYNDGMPNPWSFVHLTEFAVRGAGLIMAEASAVSPEGRITPKDAGIWNDDQARVWKGIVDTVHLLGDTKIGIQIAHAGRKASTYELWDPVQNGTSTASVEDGGWPDDVVSASAERFQDDYPLPKPASSAEIQRLITSFKDAAIRANNAGFDVLELHFAHGYLVHQFLSPLSNKRTDAYGGSFENRTRFAVEIVKAVRPVWPQSKPLFIRISCTDWVEGGWDIDQSVELAKIFKSLGVDAIDCSSGGASPLQKIPTAFKAYQVPFAERIRKDVPGLLTVAVGQIHDPNEANEIVVSGKGDIVALGRVFLGNPNWVLDAAKVLGVSVGWAAQYIYGAGGKSKRRQIAEEKAQENEHQAQLKHGAVSAQS
ncbi:oxidoreductase, FAD/FMN-binding protein [Gaertneriomyces semiglobifer]|nr:oxidoreductase, FAD/FMN-binding protein [Gaertneriomyces semiglobifer]